MRRSILRKLARVTSVGLVALAATMPARAEETLDQVNPLRAAMYKKFSGMKVVFISMNQAGEHGKTWYGSMKSMLEPMGISVEVRDTNFDTNVGAQAFAQAIAQKANLIVAWNPDRNSYARLIQQAQAAGIYVVSMNLGSAAPADILVGPDWADILTQQTKAIVKACQGTSGKVSIVAGSNNSAIDVEGMAAVNAVLKDHAEIKIVNRQYADWNTSKAHDITAAVLKQNPDLCAVLGFWNGMDQGAAAAVAEAGMKGKVFVSTSGSGLQDGACEKVTDGTFGQYVSYNVNKQGPQLADLIKALLSSAAKPGELKAISYTTLTSITKDNAAKPGVCWTLDQ